MLHYATLIETTCFSMCRKLWMNSCDVAGGNIIGTSTDINAGNNTHAIYQLTVNYLNISLTSTCCGTVIAPTVYLSSVVYADSSGLDKLIIKRGMWWEFRDKTKFYYSVHMEL